MRLVLLLALLSGAPLSAAPMPAGVWSNAEDQYFRGEAGEAIPYLGLRVADGPEGLRWQRVDAFGVADGAWVAGAPPATMAGGEAVMALGPGSTRLRQARAFRCWVSVKRERPKPDGGADWSFHRDLMLHDQGGRLLVAEEPGNAPGLVLRMRNVVWPAPSPNRPSLVLYVHAAHAPDTALSYSWADPGARMLGINLRWMQASCTRAG